MGRGRRGPRSQRRPWAATFMQGAALRANAPRQRRLSVHHTPVATELGSAEFAHVGARGWHLAPPVKAAINAGRLGVISPRRMGME